MFDSSITEALTSYFADLGRNIEFVVSPSQHENQSELTDMLNAVAATSNNLSVRMNDAPSDVPAFSVWRDGKPTGVSFVGIPGGHEFSSLILAVLNTAGKGKMPDAGLTARIRSLKGGAKIRTYISLTCENCPDVVQALNQIAIAHGNIEHTMVDGQYAQEELGKLNIQGVPSVVINGTLVHSGRANLSDLLAKLEENLGSEGEKKDVDLGHFDVVVLGGGPAGSSAAIYSVRKGIKTAIIAEKLGGQLQETKGIENMISVPYTEGMLLSSNIDKHLRAYPVEILEHRRVRTVESTESGAKLLRLDSGEHLTAGSVIIATGAKWRELGVPGEKEYIGRGVAFCPHCDGPYYKDKRVSVIGGGNSGVEAAIDLAGICSEVTLFEFTDKLKADEVLVQKLKTLSNVTVHTNAKTTGVVGNGEKVVGMEWEDRTTGEKKHLDLDGVFVQIGLSPNSGFVKDLVETNRYGEIIIDEKGRTSAPGIYAAGDVTTVPFKQIVIAMGEGAKVALTAFEDRMKRVS
jgi:alkyl hydroperoxide reductase subunit F